MDSTGQDQARIAAVNAAADMVTSTATVALGSGRAVFALTEVLGAKHGSAMQVVTASEKTAALAKEVGLQLVQINDVDGVAIAFDGADELDSQLQLIKGAGAALLREKLVFAVADRVVIVAEEPKLVERLGTSCSLPVEIVPFAWSHTLDRLIDLTGEALMWTNEDGTPFVTDNGNHLADVVVPADADLRQFAMQLKSTLGVIEHGLFLDQASEAILGRPDGTISHLTR